MVCSPHVCLIHCLHYTHLFSQEVISSPFISKFVVVVGIISNEIIVKKRNMPLRSVHAIVPHSPRRPVDEYRAANDVLLGQEAPNVPVQTVVPVVAQD